MVVGGISGGRAMSRVMRLPLVRQEARSFSVQATAAPTSRLETLRKQLAQDNADLGKGLGLGGMMFYGFKNSWLVVPFHPIN